MTDPNLKLGANGASVPKAFPLRRYYRNRMLPTMAVFMAILSVALWFSFEHVTRNIYLEQSLSRAQTIAESVRHQVPEAWAHLIEGNVSELDVDTLHRVFEDESQNQRLVKLKAYDLRGLVLHSDNLDQIGDIETADAFRQSVITAKPVLNRKEEAGIGVVYEIYAPYFDKTGTMRMVFELYEKVDYLDSLLIQTAGPAIALPIALQILLALFLSVLVGRAQKQINAGVRAISDLTNRLQTLVSSSALEAAQNAEGATALPSKSMICTLFYSDVRDFTGYSEDNSPERVVAFLNDVMTIQINAVQAHGGDVDKLIGDALLVRFEGDDAPQRAWTAAKSILEEVDRATLARELGIGIFTGTVISGAIGPADRRDYTVIGDSVNVAARLCSQAGAGEVVMDIASADGIDDLSQMDQETVSVKGRHGDLRVVRWSVRDK